MRAHDHRLPVALRQRVQGLDQAANAGLLVDVFLAVRADHEIAVLFEPEPREDVGPLDLRPVVCSTSYIGLPVLITWSGGKPSASRYSRAIACR